MAEPRTRREFSGRRLWAVLLLFVAAQVWFAINVRDLRAAIDEVPPAPTAAALKALALGDNEFLFRYLARWMEFVGDGGGRIRPLREYDYDRVVNWMQALDELDQYRSDLTHAIAARYFGEITSAVDLGNVRLRKIVDYLRLAALRDPARFWPWLVWDAHKARKPLNDMALVKALAKDLQSPELRDKSVPAWVRVLPIQLYQAAGDTTAAQDALARVTPEDKKEVEDMRRSLSEAIQKRRRDEVGTDAPPAQAK